MSHFILFRQGSKECDNYSSYELIVKSPLTRLEAFFRDCYIVQLSHYVTLKMKNKNLSLFGFSLHLLFITQLENTAK